MRYISETDGIQQIGYIHVVDDEYNDAYNNALMAKVATNTEDEAYLNKLIENLKP